MEGNPFWVLVKELYPLFLQVILVFGLYRMGKGVWHRLQGDEEGIGKAMHDIITGFFWAHMAIPLVYAIWRVMGGISDKATTVFEIIDKGGF